MSEQAWTAESGTGMCWDKQLGGEESIPLGVSARRIVEVRGYGGVMEVCCALMR